MENKHLEFIKKGGELLAVIIRKDYIKNGTEFFTPEHFPQQVGFIFKKKGEIIEAHTHRQIKREISLTQEVLLIRKGSVKVNFYDSEKNYFNSRILEKGDVVLLAGGGQSYEALDDTEMIEIKQGPYLGKDDKINFKGIESP